jgi:hypothetical protein
MNNRNKLGFIIVSYEYDYERVKYTLKKSDIDPDDNIVIIWTGGKSVDETKVHTEIVRYSNEIGLNNVKFISFNNMKCLKARKAGFDYMKSQFPDVEFVQFIDSGDYVSYDDRDEYMNQLVNSKSDLFWSPVKIHRNDLEQIIEDECDYSSVIPGNDRDYSLNRRSRYSSYSINDDKLYEIIKEDFDKIIDSSKLISVREFESLYANYSGLELGYDSRATKINGDFKRSWVNKPSFSLRCPSITAYPWRVDVLTKTFNSFKIFNMNYDVNIAEDLLFHTIARHIYKNESGEVSCGILQSSYVYLYYPDSLTHKYHTDEDDFELNSVRQFCLNLINGNLESDWKSEPKDECACASEEPAYEEEDTGDHIITYMGVQIHPIRFKHVTCFSEKDSYICWNDTDKNAVICAVLSYIPGAKFCVITGDKVYQHMAKIPNKEVLDRVLPKWNIMGWAHSNEPENDRLISIQIPWDGEDIKMLKSRLGAKLNVDPYKIELQSMVKLGAVL